MSVRYATSDSAFIPQLHYGCVHVIDRENERYDNPGSGKNRIQWRLRVKYFREIDMFMAIYGYAVEDFWSMWGNSTVFWAETLDSDILVISR